MEQSIKQRLVGAGVLLILAAIFLPHLLKGPSTYDDEFYDIRIPPQPDEQFGNFEPEQKDFALSVPTSVIPKVLTIPSVEQEVVATVPVLATTQSPAVSAATVVPANQAAGSKVIPVIINDDDKVVNERVTTQIQPQPTTKNGAWVVQVASFKSKKNALRLRDQLRDHAHVSFVEELKTPQGVIFRVRVGPELRKTEAQRVRSTVEQLTGLKALVLAYP